MRKLAFVSAFLLGTLLMGAGNLSATVENGTTDTSVSMYEVSPFCMAIVKGDFETVKKLVEMGQDIEERSAGLTPLMYAARFNKTEILEYLIEKGANLKAKCSNLGFTALKYAELSNAAEAKAILEKALNA